MANNIKNKIKANAAEFITSAFLQKQKRRFHKNKALMLGQNNSVDVYLRVDDPYSYLLVQAITELRNQSSLSFTPHILYDVPQELYPDYEKLEAYALRDARDLAQHYQLDFKSQSYPNEALKQAASGLLLSLENDEAFFTAAKEVFELYWAHDNERLSQLSSRLNYNAHGSVQALLKSRAAQLLKRGHYLSASMYFQGEWYWGIDRLHYLLSRVKAAGSTHWRRSALAQPKLQHAHIEMFFSFRSPYSYIALSELMRLQKQQNFTLTIQPVLPMVMRGMAVPKAKKFYILLDAAREARTKNIAFGRVSDPVGKGVENCMALLAYAQEAGLANEFCLLTAQQIWSQGTDMTDNKNLQLLIEQLGLNWPLAKKALQDESWRAKADENRAQMFALGLWGVPSFKRDELACWGQDRLWALSNSQITQTNH